MKCANLVLLILFVINCYGDHLEEVTVAVQLLEMDLEDQCTNVADVNRKLLLRTQDSRKEKIEIEKSTATFIRDESKKLRTSYDVSDIELSEELQRQWDIFNKMGDVELPEEEWNELVSFKNSNEELLEKLQVPCYNKTKGCLMYKKDILKRYATSRDQKELKQMWSASHDIFSIYRKQFPNILKLTEKAAKANDQETVRKYWEMLVEYPDAYEKAKELWAEIEPLYVKFHNFVKGRLEKHYSEVKKSDSIPAYLLGSEFGTDWSNIASLVLPHRYLYDEIISMLEFDQIGGKKTYEIAEKFTSTMGLGKAGSTFWSESLFDQQCPSQLITRCSEQTTYVITCNHTGWTEYLDAHEDMLQVTLNNVNYPAIAYNAFRISALDESLVGLSNLLALRNLPMAGIVPEDIFEPPEDFSETNINEMSSLFLSALRILPRLPYYLLADTWRLDLIENNENLDFNKTVESWWEHRNSIQKVKGVTNTEFDFLADQYIVSNKPYIGNFLGTIIQFQFLEHFDINNHDGSNVLLQIADNADFRNLLKDRATYDWNRVMRDHFFYDIQADALLQYFKPLEEYMDNAPTKQVTQTVRPKTTTTPATTTIKTAPPQQSEKIVVSITEKTQSNETIAKKVDSNSKSGNLELHNMMNDFIQISKKVNENAKPVVTDTETDASTTSSVSSSATATWIGVAIGVVTLSVIVILLARKKCRRKPVITNRRHEV